jgi:methylated-DNA-[protein]-cysteine S-methyltransferase
MTTPTTPKGLAMHVRTIIPSPVGPLTLVASQTGLRAVLWEHERPSRVRLPTDIVDVGAGDDPVLAAAAEQLTAYFSGDRKEFDVPLDLQGTEFQRLVWLDLTEIPYGSTVTYGDQARRAGGAEKTRAVAGAVGRNPVSVIVPCHRVVGSDGSLTGFAGGLPAKRFLLDLEAGVRPIPLDAP